MTTPSIFTLRQRTIPGSGAGSGAIKKLCSWEWGRLGSYGIPMGMGVRSAMGSEWDGNGN